VTVTVTVNITVKGTSPASRAPYRSSKTHSILRVDVAVTVARAAGPATATHQRTRHNHTPRFMDGRVVRAGAHRHLAPVLCVRVGRVVWLGVGEVHVGETGQWAVPEASLSLSLLSLSLSPSLTLSLSMSLRLFPRSLTLLLLLLLLLRCVGPAFRLSGVQSPLAPQPPLFARRTVEGHIVDCARGALREAHAVVISVRVDAGAQLVHRLDEFGRSDGAG